MYKSYFYYLGQTTNKPPHLYLPGVLKCLFWSYLVTLQFQPKTTCGVQAARGGLKLRVTLIFKFVTFSGE